MTSWVMWEIWWSRVWGEHQPASLAGEHEDEVAHEPARLPAELIAQGKATHSPRPEGEALLAGMVCGVPAKGRRCECG